MNIVDVIKKILVDHSVWKILFASIPVVLSCIFLLYLLLYVVMREPVKVVLFVCGGMWVTWGLSYLGELFTEQYASKRSGDE